jgi:hypothetical protein
MPAPFTRRLAGIRFVTQPPQLPERLPRMDIAVFIGFASAGPMHQPVVVEDAAQFAAIFGDDLPLAWDGEKGTQSFACLAPAVRAFFRNGGRRSWVIRVAREPETNFFPLPGLARVDGGTLFPAFARARSPGSWFDSFRAATALAVRSIELLDWEPNWETIYAILPRQDDLRAGDLLRLTFRATRQEAFFVVDSVAPVELSPPDLRRGRVAVRVKLLGTLKRLAVDEVSGQPFEAVWEPSPKAAAVSGSGNVVATGASPPDSDDDRLTILVRQNSSPPMGTDASAGFSPPPGALLLLSWSQSDRLWFQVEETELPLKGGSSSAPAVRIVGRAFSWTNLPPPSPPSLPAAERLTFEMDVRRTDTSAARMIDLGFASAHPRCWNALPDDDKLFGAPVGDAHEALWSEAGELRFPLAGGYDPETYFIPLGMSALAEPMMAAHNSARSALERDGLAKFSSALFLDNRLLDSGVSTLIEDADFIRYQMPGPPLTGIHAALEIEEASLIAVPDAVQRGWHPADPAEFESPLLSNPRSHPSWWHSLECDPPESPPAGARAPNYGLFMKCGLLVLDPPTLSVEEPDAGGAFTLEWSHTSPKPVESILEEATEPDFGDAVEIWRGGRSSYTILSRAPGTYYYRVRIEAEGESSDWSNETAIMVSAGAAWQINEAGAFELDTLLEVHRGLLRLCAARGDIMAVLALPEHFREDDALAYLDDLKSTRPSSGGREVRPLGTGEEPAFSYAAVYHPWLIVREEIQGLLSTPPDGAASGLIAARSLTRGAWIAPANEAFSRAVSLTPRLGPERYLDLLLAQLNLIRQEPRGFLSLSADTLSFDDELRPINVRRLLILLRRAALRLGMRWVFEPNDRVLRGVVQGAFESIMQQLFTRGAFAGATPDASYRVVTDDTVNTPQDFDQGRFRVDLKVAPALPMSFLTVRLVQMGERAVTTEII